MEKAFESMIKDLETLNLENQKLKEENDQLKLKIKKTKTSAVLQFRKLSVDHRLSIKDLLNQNAKNIQKIKNENQELGSLYLSETNKLENKSIFSLSEIYSNDKILILKQLIEKKEIEINQKSEISFFEFKQMSSLISEIKNILDSH